MLTGDAVLWRMDASLDLLGEATIFTIPLWTWLPHLHDDYLRDRGSCSTTRESAVNLPGKFEKRPEEGGSADGDCLMDTGSRHASNLKE